MRVESYIDFAIPKLAPTDTVADALEVMAECLQPELPLCDGDHFLGIVKESVLTSLPSDELELGNLPQPLSGAVVHEGDHFFELIKVAGELQVQLVAVVDGEDMYVGAIPTAALVQHMGKGISVQTPGGVLVLGVRQVDYSLAEIARLVESNEAKILTSYIEADPDDYTLLRVCLRINRTDLSRVIATLERFGYSIMARFHQSDTPDLDKERLDSLLRFLDI